jgi:hypothetical protein
VCGEQLGPQCPQALHALGQPAAEGLGRGHPEISEAQEDCRPGRARRLHSAVLPKLIALQIHDTGDYSTSGKSCRRPPPSFSELRRSISRALGELQKAGGSAALSDMKKSKEIIVPTRGGSEYTMADNMSAGCTEGESPASCERKLLNWRMLSDSGLKQRRDGLMTELNHWLLEVQGVEQQAGPEVYPK